MWAKGESAVKEQREESGADGRKMLQCFVTKSSNDVKWVRTGRRSRIYGKRYGTSEFHNVWAILNYLYQQPLSSSSVCYTQLSVTVDSLGTSHIASLVGLKGIHSGFWPTEKMNANRRGLEGGGL
jgi:hypothetical protein